MDNFNMDPDVEIMYLAMGGEPYKKEQVHVNLSKDFNRRNLPEPSYEAAIESNWLDRVGRNPHLWNGTKFRLHATRQQPRQIQSSEQSGGNSAHPSVVFDLGLTDYRDFLGTNWSPRASEYRALGSRHHLNSQAYMSDALGVGALVQTADNFFVLLRRSKTCGEAVGLWDIPGGHPEPQELVGKLPLSDINLSEMSSERVHDEIFGSTLREIVDEVNIPAGTLSTPELIGVARNVTSAGRPSSEYLCRCTLTSEEIRQRYTVGDHVEASESTGILFVSMATIPDLQETNRSLWGELAPSAKGCLTLYRLLLQNTN